MQCADVLNLVEPIAAGDLPPDERVREHLHSCPACAGALASAQRLETRLKGMEIPAAPAAFASQVLQRIRRDRWRSEHLIAGGLLALLNVGTVMSLTGSLWTLLKEGSRETVRTAAPTVLTYIAAAGLLASALGMWAWAERRMQF
jgi:predicted anti-sigma-YlaC factor YlaD